MSFLIFILIEIIKIIVFILNKTFIDYLAIFFEIISIIFHGLYLIYIKGLIKYKFISPYKCNFIIGLIDFPLIIIIYLIISFTSLGNENNKYYIDNIFTLFRDGLDIIDIIRLILLSLTYGIFSSLINKIIYDFTIYHIFIPFFVEKFIMEIIVQIKNRSIFNIIFLILCFLFEIIMIFIFLEIIELNFCGLNKNLKKNIKLRALIESPLEIENYNDDKVDNGRNIINNENKKMNLVNY